MKFLKDYVNSEIYRNISKSEWIQSDFHDIPKTSKVIAIHRNTYQVIKGNVESSSNHYITFSNRKRNKILYPQEYYIFLAPNYYNTKNRKAMEYLLYSIHKDNISVSEKY